MFRLEIGRWHLIYPKFNSRHKGLTVSTHSCLPWHSMVEVNTHLKSVMNPGFMTDLMCC